MNLQLVEGTSLQGKADSFRKCMYSIQGKFYKPPLAAVSEHHNNCNQVVLNNLALLLYFQTLYSNTSCQVIFSEIWYILPTKCLLC